MRSRLWRKIGNIGSNAFPNFTRRFPSFGEYKYLSQDAVKMGVLNWISGWNEKKKNSRREIEKKSVLAWSKLLYSSIKNLFMKKRKTHFDPKSLQWSDVPICGFMFKNKLANVWNSSLENHFKTKILFFSLHIVIILNFIRQTVFNRTCPFREVDLDDTFWRIHEVIFIRELQNV